MCCKALVENGATVWVVSRKKGAVEEACTALNGLSTATGRAIPFPADVGTDAECIALAVAVGAKESKVCCVSVCLCALCRRRCGR